MRNQRLVGRLGTVTLGVIVAASVAVPAASAADPVPTTTTLSVSPNPVRAGDWIHLEARVEPAPPGDEAYMSFEVVGETEIARERVSGGIASADVRTGISEAGFLAQGTIQVMAHTENLPEGYADSMSAPVDLVIERLPSSIELGAGFTPDTPRSAPYTPFDDIRVFIADELDPCTGDAPQLSRWTGTTWASLPVAGGDMQLRTQPGGDPWCGSYSGDLPLTVGVHELRAFWNGNDAYSWSEDSLQVEVIRQPVTAHVAASPATAEVGTPVELVANVRADGVCCPWGSEGTMTFFDGSVELGEVPMGVNNATLVVPDLAVGSHAIHVTYSGTAQVAPATSTPFTVSVTPNVVHVEQVRVLYPTFYPILDRYIDAQVMKGYRHEDAGVTIRIQSVATGRTVRTLSVPVAEGWYTATWNGRTSAGALAAAGRYRITQTITDEEGASRAFAANISLSHKRLVTRTTTLTRDGNRYTAKGSLLGGSVSSSSKYGGGVRLRTGKEGAWAGVGFQFSLPKAVRYSRITIAALGSGRQRTTISAHDWRYGSWRAGKPWIIEWFLPRRRLASGYSWTSQTISTSHHRRGRTVQVLVLAQGPSSASYDLDAVRLVVRYTVLN